EQAVDVRIVAATHRDLRSAARAGSFREDLLYRLDVVSIAVPPLRSRRDDILPLIDHFLQGARRKHATSLLERFSTEAAEAVLAYDWPGNVRELEHVIERLVVLGRGAEVELADVPALIRERAPSAPPEFAGEIVPIRELERRYAAWALEQMSGHRGRTAQKL